MSKIALTLPGQGIEKWQRAVELAERSPAARRVYDEVEQHTGLNIPETCSQEGTIEDTRIVHQLLVGVSSAEAAHLIEEKKIKIDYLLPHSAGGFAAAAINKALSLKDALLAAKERGGYIYEEGHGKGGLIAVRHPKEWNLEYVKKLMKDIQGAYVATRNSPVQTGIAFLNEAHLAVIELIIKSGAIPTDIKGLNFAPHNETLDAARLKLAALLGELAFKKPKIPTISPYTLKIINKAAGMKNDLERGVTELVDYEGSINVALKNGVTIFFEAGPTRVISRLLRKEYELPANIKIDPNLD